MLASSWNCYAGTSADALYLQNATPIPLGTTSYTLADKPALSGNRLQPGQWSDYNFSWQHMLQRS
jgi:hypothetical protein